MGTLLLVHAHPDDETIATGGVMLRAHREGHRVVLVTCTRGEEGQIFTFDEAATRPRLGEVREAELRRACDILGVDRLEFLGYRDSGMAGTPSNEDPRCFHAAPLEEAARRLAAIIEEEHPEVVVSYTPDGTYGHPDHIKASMVTGAAVELLREAGDGSARLYWHAVPASSVAELRRHVGQDDEALTQMARIGGWPDAEISLEVDVRDLAGEKRKALEEHVTQMDPNGPFSTMQGQLMESALGTEHFVVVGDTEPPHRQARSLLGG
ncbi:MAG TPA: PIG-L family deacetylase [Candidatus Dormibacteraeota bacterium]|jgi:N-acetyl-1-D-myo-inositol-2-amino-2-deoxy-alpha-D-glucopyranoside deacetylase|nr:PIG-L family deacetylase [Candidatus Dormibacteraeota bacterium]